MAENRLKLISSGISGAFLIAYALVTPFLRSGRTTWGATSFEVKRSLPGDDLLPDPKWQFTQATTIKASQHMVWKWLVQIGQGRGGFYSYELLENMVGCCIQNADSVIPRYQDLIAGNEIKMHPKAPGFQVVTAIPDNVIILYGDTRKGNSSAAVEQLRRNYLATTWVFFIESVDDHITRLLARLRSDYSQSFINSILNGPWLSEPISTTMQRKMLMGIKERAEATMQMEAD